MRVAGKSLNNTPSKFDILFFSIPLHNYSLPHNPNINPNPAQWHPSVYG